MMEYWNAIVELTDTFTGRDLDEDLLDRFTDWHGSIGRSANGRLELILSVPAESLRQATLTVLSLFADKEVDNLSQLRVLTAADFDRENGLQPVPPLVSVTEAAALLNISRQRVLQMINEGKLHGLKVGAGWALTRTEVDNLGAIRDNVSKTAM